MSRYVIRLDLRDGGELVGVSRRKASSNSRCHTVSGGKPCRQRLLRAASLSSSAATPGSTHRLCLGPLAAAQPVDPRLAPPPIAADRSTGGDLNGASG